MQDQEIKNLKKSLSLGFFLEFLSKMKLFLILAIPFLQVACTSAQDIFITNDLPEAKIDQPYSVKILMRPARLDESSFKVETNSREPKFYQYKIQLDIKVSDYELMFTKPKMKISKTVMISPAGEKMEVDAELLDIVIKSTKQYFNVN